MKMKTSFLLVVFSCYLVGSVDLSKTHSRKTYMSYIDKVLIALEKVIRFFAEDYQDINLDGIFGLRVAEGAMKKILEEDASGIIHIDSTIKSRIRILKSNAHSAAEKSLPFLMNENLKYFQEFKKTIISPWPNFKPFQKLDHNEIPMPALQKKDFVEFDEEKSDNCMTEISGTQKGHSSERCYISDKCWKMETQGKTTGYALTHQGLYLLLGEVQGCKNKINERLRKSNFKGGLKKLYSRICTSVYTQMTHIERSHKLQSSGGDRDLYMEQAMVCGTMGFSDFLSIGRLSLILSWQMDKGCFGSAENQQNKELQRVVSDELRTLEKPPEGFDRVRYARKIMSKKTMRKILVEKDLKDGCMSHITGVATGVLGVYLKWLLHSLSTINKFNNSMFAHERLIDRMAESVPLAPRQDQWKPVHRRSVLQDEQSAQKIVEGQPQTQSIRNWLWKICFVAVVVLVWVVAVRLKAIRRVLLHFAAYRSTPYLKV